MIMTEAALVIPDSIAIDNGQPPTFGGKGNKNAKATLIKRIKKPITRR
ncbi:MAG: hypothetical protein WBC50_02910 [Dehalococcoidales bacterium]